MEGTITLKRILAAKGAVNGRLTSSEHEQQHINPFMKTAERSKRPVVLTRLPVTVA